MKWRAEKTVPLQSPCPPLTPCADSLNNDQALPLRLPASPISLPSPLCSDSPVPGWRVRWHMREALPPGCLFFWSSFSLDPPRKLLAGPRRLRLVRAVMYHWLPVERYPAFRVLFPPPCQVILHPSCPCGTCLINFFFYVESFRPLNAYLLLIYFTSKLCFLFV